MRSFLVTVLLLVSSTASSQRGDETRRHYVAANAHYAANRYVLALDAYDSALASSRHEFVLYQKGLTLQKLDRDQQAIAAFREALAIFPAFPAGYHGLATSYLRMRRFDSAATGFRRALREQPGLESARVGLLVALTMRAVYALDKNDTATAIRVAREAIEVDSSAAEARVVLARAYNMTGRYIQSIEVCDALLSLPGTLHHPAAWFEKGIALRNLNDEENARAAFSVSRKDSVYATQSEAELQRLRR